MHTQVGRQYSSDGFVATSRIFGPIRMVNTGGDDSERHPGERGVSEVGLRADITMCGAVIEAALDYVGIGEVDVCAINTIREEKGYFLRSGAQHPGKKNSGAGLYNLLEGGVSVASGVKGAHRTYRRKPGGRHERGEMMGPGEMMEGTYMCF
jgi:hypothetical protein